MLKINPSLKKNKITSFIKTTLQKEGFKNVIIGMSGGVDSTTSFYLLKEAVAPQNIFIAHLYYFESHFKDIENVLKKAKVPKENIYEMSIDPLVEALQHNLFPSRHSGKPSQTWRTQNPKFWLVQNLSQQEVTAVRDSGVATLPRMTDLQQIRLGNIMARIRMIILYDLAKKHNALVCGTENRSEYLLGYFTRFGDQASDFETIQHLYKTQVYELAKFLGVPKNIMEKTPTAGLWHGQTDEGEFGFTYKEADQVLFYYFDKKLKLEDIKKKGFANAEKIIGFTRRNSYKHRVPYVLSSTNNNPNINATNGI